MGQTDQDPKATGHPLRAGQPDAPEPSARPGIRRALVGALLLLVIAGVTIAVGAGLYLQSRLTALGPLAEATTVVIPRGAGTGRIAAVLVRHGVIADASIFVMGARLLARARPLRAGEYAFPASINALGAMLILQSGTTVVRSLTVPEGLTTAEALALIAAAEGLVGDTPPVDGEGALLPETYHYSWGDSADDIVARMRRAMDEALAELWLERDESVPYTTPHDALVLASIVEKETSVAEERAHVAAVFVNRLRQGMRLQSDPTVVFALTQGAAPLGRALLRDDLQVQSPYNTYVIVGLPPGPIANPGRASLEAVLHPADSEDLFFVADGNGGHAFAKTLREHQRNVAKWRQLNR